MAIIKTYQCPNDIQRKFESASTHILLYDPVHNKRIDRAGNNRGSEKISDATGEEADISSLG